MPPSIRRNPCTALSLFLAALAVAGWVSTYSNGFLIGHWSRQARADNLFVKCSGFFSRRGELGYAATESRESIRALSSGPFGRPPNTTPVNRTGIHRTRDIGLPLGPIRDEDHTLGFFASADVSYSYGTNLNGTAWNGLDRRSYSIVPYWFLVLLLLILPLRRLHQYRRDHLARVRERRRGFCPACGYDLRATPTRCPECGHRPTGIDPR